MKGRDRIVLIALSIIGLFIFTSMLLSFLLVWTGRIEDVATWRPLYDLVAILVGGIGGYITGTSIERDKKDE